MKTILLVEDDRDIRETYADILKAAGYATEQAENGRVALQKLAALVEPPCLVLLDMMMPEMTGAELLDALHDSGKLVAMPVILVSASDCSPRQRRGSRGFVKKPISLETLLQLVSEFCGPP